MAKYFEEILNNIADMFMNDLTAPQIRGALTLLFDTTKYKLTDELVQKEIDLMEFDE